MRGGSKKNGGIGGTQKYKTGARATSAVITEDQEKGDPKVQRRTPGRSDWESKAKVGSPADFEHG